MLLREALYFGNERVPARCEARMSDYGLYLKKLYVAIGSAQVEGVVGNYSGSSYRVDVRNAVRDTEVVVSTGVHPSMATR